MIKKTKQKESVCILMDGRWIESTDFEWVTPRGTVDWIAKPATQSTATKSKRWVQDKNGLRKGRANQSR
jgi:hypothetical protein